MAPKPPSDPLAQLDPVAAAATRWFVILHEDPADAGQLAEFTAWRDADPAHAAAYARVQRLWGAAGHLPSLQRQDAPVDRRSLLRTGAGLLGAGFLAAGAGRLVFGPHPLADYTTAIGERRTVALSDGSAVEMSTRTALSIDFDQRERRVRLLDGEAWFRVARDPRGRPFAVEAAGGTTTALGTAFAVARAGDGATVTVTEHAVRVAACGATRTISAGQMCRYGGERLDPMRAADPTALSWRNGQLVFISRPLGEVVATLDRWRAGRTIILDQALARHPVTLMIATADVGDALPRLGASLPMRISEITPLLTLVRGAP